MIYLNPGNHKIIPSKTVELQKGCGLIPVNGRCNNVITEGLKWNLGHTGN